PARPSAAPDQRLGRRRTMILSIALSAVPVAPAPCSRHLRTGGDQLPRRGLVASSRKPSRHSSHIQSRRLEHFDAFDVRDRTVKQGVSNHGVVQTYSASSTMSLLHVALSTVLLTGLLAGQQDGAPPSHRFAELPRQTT